MSSITLQEAWSIGEWQKTFKRTYGHRNRKAGQYYVWMRMLEEIGEVVRSVRYYRSAKDNVGLALPDLFAWLCAFCDIEGISLDDAVWNQYQSCPFCHKGKECECGPNPSGETRPRVKRKEPPPRPMLPIPLVEWEQRLERIYGRRNNTLQAIDLIARLTDHAGRVARALRTGAGRRELEPLVADVFAWTIAVWNGLRSSADSAMPSFATLVARKYDGRCPTCRQSRCACRELARVFIGSAMGDQAARDLRARASTTLRELGLQPRGFDDVPLEFEYNPQVEALRVLADSDVLLLILDRPPSEMVRGEVFSALAQSKSLWIAVLQRAPGGLATELTQFVQPLQQTHFTEHFTPEADLADAIRRLHRRARAETTSELLTPA